MVLTESERQFNPLRLDYATVLYTILKQYEYLHEKQRLVFEEPLAEWKQLNPGKPDEDWDGTSVDSIYKATLESLRHTLMHIQEQGNEISVPIDERFLELLIGYVEYEPYGFLDEFLTGVLEQKPDLPSFEELIQHPESMQLLFDAYTETAQYGTFPTPSVDSPVNMELPQELTDRFSQAQQNVQAALDTSMPLAQ